MDNLEEIIEIRDPDINVAEIMNKIRENLAKRPPPEIDVSSLRYEAWRLGGYLSLEEKLEQNLQQALSLRDKVFVGDQLRPARGLVQKALISIKRQFHQLVRFYVDLASARQVGVNIHLSEALSALAEKVKEDEEKIKRLEERLKKLEGGGN